MTTETTTTAPTKAEMYNEIGKLNLQIVKLDQDIIELEHQVSKLGDDPEFQMATQQSLREARQFKEQLDNDVRRIRKTILGRMEIEVEHLERNSQTEPMKEKLSMLGAASFLKKEIETLKLLTAV